MTPSQHGSSSLHETQASPPNAESGSSRTASVERKDSPSSDTTRWQRIPNVLCYTPERCRYDPANPPKFSIGLNLLFAFAGAFTVANLYYNHPILHLLAGEFNVSNERASLIPTLAQAGYASGLVFLCPLGDVFPRRLYVLALVLFTATVWYVQRILSWQELTMETLLGWGYVLRIPFPSSASSPSLLLSRQSRLS